MAPSTDQLLHCIYGNFSSASLMLIVVKAALVSVMLLLGCAFFKKFRTKEVNLTKSQRQRAHSELKRVTVHKNNGIQETTGVKNGAIAIGTEGNCALKEKANDMSASIRLNNGAALSSVKYEPDTSPLMSRVLPLPPENLQAAPPAAEMEDPLYETVKEIKEQVLAKALSNKEDATNISESIKATDPENQEPLKLEQINPLYVSAEEVKESPLYREATSDLPSPETNERDEDDKTQMGNDPLYAVVRKEPSMKNPQTQNPGERSKLTDSVLQKVVLPDKLKSIDQTVHFVTYMEQKPLYPESPAEKVDSMLTYWKKKSVKPTQSPKENMTTVNVVHEVPPPVPVKLFDPESEIEQHTIEEETA